MGMHKWKCEKINVNPYLYSFLIINPANHLYTHLSNFTEGWLFQANVSEYFDHPLPDADTSVLYCQKRKKSLYLEKIHNTREQKQTVLLIYLEKWLNEVQWQLSANRWHFKPTMRMNFSWTLVNISMTTGTTISMQPVSICWARGTTLVLSFLSFITEMQNFKYTLQSNFSFSLWKARKNQIIS